VAYIRAVKLAVKLFMMLKLHSNDSVSFLDKEEAEDTDMNMRAVRMRNCLDWAGLFV
jgi:hypothetical protein